MNQLRKHTRVVVEPSVDSTYVTDFSDKLVTTLGFNRPNLNLQERFELLLSSLLEMFSSVEPRFRIQVAIDVINIFRALNTGPLVPGFQLVNAKLYFKRAIQVINRHVALPWSEFDVSTVPPEQDATVNKLKKYLFGPEPHSLIRKVGLFGRLSVEALEKDYLSRD